jgi:N-acyl-D-amino-acid deacylase
MWADITVFDSETIRDNSTYLEPAQGPSGIEYVFVNGQMAVDRGELLRTASRPAGQVLRH